MLEKIKILKSVTQGFTLRNYKKKKNNTLNPKEIMKTRAEINKKNREKSMKTNISVWKDFENGKTLATLMKKERNLKLSKS